jgi:hypothetical protein
VPESSSTLVTVAFATRQDPVAVDLVWPRRTADDHRANIPVVLLRLAYLGVTNTGWCIAS